MGLCKDVTIKVEGQVPDDSDDNEYEILLAEIKLICAKHGLTCTEE